MVVKDISSNALLPGFSGLCLFTLCDLTQVPHPHCVLRSRAVMTAVPTAGAAARVSEFICATAKRRAKGSASVLVIFVSSRRGGSLSHDILNTETFAGHLKDKATTLAGLEMENARATWSNQTIPVIWGVKTAWEMV